MILHKDYHLKGQKKTEGTFNGGKWNGMATNWYENGQKKTKGPFQDGEKVGK
jgi:antitoxin component YwqK of YwqJK toxin-antitoxin module